MKITLLTLLTISSSVLSALTVVPSKINYQGLITDTDGSPIVSTTNTITAYLYGTESGGTALYSDSFFNVNSDTNGIYSIEIGDVGLQSVLEGNNELWLELIINQQTLSPRQKINSVPYALVAKAAESIVPGSDADAAISTNASNISALQTDVDQNEADADQAIAALQAVDASSARQIIVDFGFTDNVPYLPSTSIDLVMPNNSGYYSCAVGDTVLLTGQINPSENGIYEITSFSYVSTNFNNANLERSLNYDSAEELNEVDLVLIEKGELSGVTFMPGAIAQTFVLGSDATTWHRLGINPNQNIEFGGRVTADELVVNGIYGSVNFDGSHNYISGNLNVSGNFDVSGNYVNFDYVNGVVVPTPDQNNEATNKAYVDAAVATNASAITTEATTRTSEITALQTDIDQNESDAEAAIAAEASTARAAEQANAYAIAAEATTARAAEQTNADAIIALQSDVDQNETDADAAIANLQQQFDENTSVIFAEYAVTESVNSFVTFDNSIYNYADYITTTLPTNNFNLGDTVLFTNLGSYKNGLYDVVYKSSDYLGLNRVENLNESSEFREGHIVFISEGNNAGAGFFLNPVGDDFVLDSTFAYEDSDISYSQFTVNLNQDINFNGLYNIFSGNLSVSGTYVNFVNVDKVMVPTPDQSNEATNKAYVDAVIATNASAITAEAATARAAEQTNADAITALQSDVVQNESDAEAAIAAEATTARTAEQANASAIAALQSDVDQNESDADTAIADIQNQLNLNPARGLINFAFEVPIYLEPAPPSSGAYYSSSNSIFYNFEIGDKILLTVQSDATENGVYEIISLEFSQGYLDRANLNRASDFDSEEELTLGVFVFVESPSVTGYVLDQRAANFVLDDPLYGAIGFSRFTVDTSEFVNFSQGINADNISGNSISAGGATIWGDMAVNNDFQAGGNTALMNTSIGGTLSVGSDTSLDNLTGNGVINFAGASSVVVPDPTISEEVANKNYVDDFVNTSIASDNAKGLVQLAVTESVSNISEYYLTYESGGSTLNPAQGDLVLLTGQTTASENGIYEVSSVNLSSSYSSSSSSGPTATDYYVSLTRASNFNSANDFLTGSFVFVEKGTHAGKGYVLGELASNFSLGTSPVNYIQFTVDASIVENNSESIIDNSVDITTATVNISNNTDSITTLQADVDQNEADAEAAIADNAQRLVLLETAAPIWGTNQTAIADNAQRLVLLETAAPIWGTNQTAIADNAQRLVLLETAAPIWGTNQTAIANLQTDVDQNEAD
ncbi:MAG: hypothetical protein VXZ45_02260, partial [Verrucomicrobiota bacterium]|nr:hypothetical protein [Verrucomicrobiota bacterium]